MRLHEIGGEFAFIRRVARPARSADVLVGIGDDCAVIQIDENRLQLVTTDMLVEGDHFSRAYFSSFEIGLKAMESNVSDVAAMGGRPRQALVALGIPEKTQVEVMDEIYAGFYQVAEDYNFDLVGGDTTRSKVLTICITLLGETTKEDLKLRSAAEPGDLIVVSGPLGGSTAGLRLFQRGIDGFENVKRHHTRPRCGMDQVDAILPIAKAMEDVSDGLASEVRNICQASGVGARLFSERIPLCDEISKTAAVCGDESLDYALYGGEDYKLVYTCLETDRHRAVGSVVGRIVENPGVMLDDQPVTRFGYDHFD